MRLLRFFAVLAVVAGCFVVSHGAEAADLCGTTITTNTTLHHNLHCSADGITIGANNVTLNLNGHTISGPAPSSGHIGVEANGFTGLTVEKGHINGFIDGIDIENSSGDHVTRMHLTNNGHAIRLCGTTDSVVSRNKITHRGRNGGDNGILLNTCGATASDSNQIVRNTIKGGASSGIRLNGATNNTVTSNRISRTGKNGIYLLGGASGNVINRNSSSRNAMFGIAVEDSTLNQITNNKVFKNRQLGIDLSVVSGTNASNTVSGNHASKNVLGGITVELNVFSATIDHDVASHNRGDGIVIGTHDLLTKISNSTANFNGGSGILAFDSAQSGGGNHAHGNRGLDQCLPHVICTR